MTPDDQLREQRQALNDAINKRDVETVKSLVHTSYVGKGKYGSSLDYQSMIRLVQRLPKDFVSQVVVQDVEISGDSAKLMVRRIEERRLDRAKTYWGAFGVGIGAGTSVWHAAGQVMRQDWWGTLSPLCVLLAMIWLAFHLRPRSVPPGVRAQETWRTVDGLWLLIEEQEL